MENHEKVLQALRKIIRVIDIRSRKLIKTCGLSGPQILVMQAIRKLGDVAIGQIAAHVNLSQATVTDILGRLEAKGMAARRRSLTDKRKVYAQLTEEGREMIRKAPTLLQEDFIERFKELKDWEQTLILSSVQRLSYLMDAQGIEAAPLLEISSFPETDPQKNKRLS